MSNVKEIEKTIDPLNETVQFEFTPTVFSTEIKSRKSQKIIPEKVQIEYSFDYTFAKTDDNTNLNSNETLNDENQSLCNQSTIYSKKELFPINELGIVENECNISRRYLEKHPRPCLTQSNSNDLDNPAAEKIPFRDIHTIHPNSRDISHFRRFSNTINDSASFINKRHSTDDIMSDSKVMSLQSKNDFRLKNNDTYDLNSSNQDEESHVNNETFDALERVEAMNLDDTTVSVLEKLLEDETLSDSLNITKLAKQFRSSATKNVYGQHTDSMSEKVTLLSNKSYLLWIGVPVQISEIKSFTLNMRSSQVHQVEIKIKRNTGCFYLTNQHGHDRLSNVIHKFEPKTDKKLYVAFHPTNSDYHSDTIVISVGNRRFKIKLFGYAEPAIVELKQFDLIDDPYKPGKQSLIKSCFKSPGQNKFRVSVFNSGARTAFVALYSHQKDIIIQPRVFLLIPKTKMEFDITLKVVKDLKLANFFIISVDEELRRAARISCLELPPSESFNIFNKLQIFSRIPEEKTIRQDDLPKYDWRPYLCRQINTSYRICYLDFNCNDGPSSTVDRWACDSVSTIGMLSKSSVTGRSALSNLECLNSKAVYVNSIASFVKSFPQALSAVVIYKDVNTFTPTCVSHDNYLGILIRNHNPFPIEWLVSDMTSTCHDSLLNRNMQQESSSDLSSTYSLTSIPIYDPASSMLVFRKEGVLQADASVVVPVRFTPENTGKTECRCLVKVFAKNDDATSEKELTFVGTAIRARKEEADGGTRHPEIPGLVVLEVPEQTLILRNLCGEKHPVQIKLKSKSPHPLELFTNRLTRPFELKIRTLVVGIRTSMIKLNFNPTEPGTYRDVLVFCDQDGNSTFLKLVFHVV